MKFRKFKDWPGPKARKVIERGKKYCATCYVDSNFVPSDTKRARGGRIYDIDDNLFIDFTAGVGVSNCGYGVGVIENAMWRHLKKTGRLQFIASDFYNKEPVDLAELLVKEMESVLGIDVHYKVFFSSSGAEANEAGLKAVFSHRPERKKIIAFRGAFHGRSGYSLPITWREHYRKDYPVSYEVTNLTFPRAGFPAYIENFKKELAALEPEAENYNSAVIELLQGEGGIYLADQAAISEFEDFCEKHKIFLHVDEVQSGYGRTGKFLVSEYFPLLQPHIITLAKGIANGYPFAATVFQEQLDWTELGRHGSTFGGNATGAVVAMATLKYLKEHKLIQRAARFGRKLEKSLKEFCDRYPGIVMNQRGIGLMQAVDFMDQDGKPDIALRDKIVDSAHQYGLLLISAGDAAIRIMPPLVIKEDELMSGLERLDAVIAEVLNEKASIEVNEIVQ